MQTLVTQVTSSTARSLGFSVTYALLNVLMDRCAWDDGGGDRSADSKVGLCAHMSSMFCEPGQRTLRPMEIAPRIMNAFHNVRVGGMHYIGTFRTPSITLSCSGIPCSLRDALAVASKASAASVTDYSSRWFCMDIMLRYSVPYDDDGETYRGLTQFSHQCHVSSCIAMLGVSRHVPHIIHECSSPTTRRHDARLVRPSMSHAHACTCIAATCTIMCIIWHVDVFHQPYGWKRLPNEQAARWED